jgi:riboflavin synthase
VGERLGGHLVQGHIDGTGELDRVAAEGNAYRMRFRFPRELARYIAMKGSIAVDGVSLTVAGLGDCWFEVAVIPHTWRETTLGDLKQGSRVNLEVDVLAKYVERLLEFGRDDRPGKSSLSIDYLTGQGY